MALRKVLILSKALGSARNGRTRDARSVIAWLLLAALAGCMAPAQPDSGTAASSQKAPVETESPLGSYLAALHAQQAHDYKNAAQLMDKALADDPNNIDLVRRTLVFRVSDGRIAQSVPLAERLADLDGNNGLPAIVLLVEAIKSGKFDDAAKRAPIDPVVFAEAGIFRRDDGARQRRRHRLERNPDAFDPRPGQPPPQHQGRHRLAITVERRHEIGDQQHRKRHGGAPAQPRRQAARPRRRRCRGRCDRHRPAEEAGR